MVYANNKSKNKNKFRMNLLVLTILFIFLVSLVSVQAITYAQHSPKWKPEWNDYIAEGIDTKAPKLLDETFLPPDAFEICPGLKGSSTDQKKAFWALFFASFAKFESGFNPGTTFDEKALSQKYGKEIISEGLLQLSYGDGKNHPPCEISKAKQNVQDPKVNLQCGTVIMKNQIIKKGVLFPDGKHYYWSVLTKNRANGVETYKKVQDYFLKYAPQLGFCGEGDVSSASSQSSCQLTTNAQPNEFKNMLILGNVEESVRVKRINGAYELMQKGNYENIIVSGGCGAHKSAKDNCESVHMAKLLEQKGVSSDKIYQEGKSGSTNSNYKNSIKLTKPDGSLVFKPGEKTVVVSNHPHAKSVAYCLRYVNKIDAYYYIVGESSVPMIVPEDSKVNYAGMVTSCMLSKKEVECASAVEGSGVVSQTPPSSISQSGVFVPQISYLPTFSSTFRKTDYSFNPSFRLDVAYDFEIYNKIVEQVKELKRCKGDVDCVEEELKQRSNNLWMGKIFSDVQKATGGDELFSFWMGKHAGRIVNEETKTLENSIGIDVGEVPEWNLYCENPAEDAVSSIAEFIDDCARVKDTNCYCEFETPERFVNLFIDFDVRLNSNPSSKNVVISLPEPLEVDQSIYSGEYGLFGSSLFGDKYKFNSKSFEVSDALLYTVRDNSLMTDALDFVTMQDTPEGKFLVGNFDFELDEYSSIYLTKNSSEIDMGLYFDVPDSSMKQCDMEQTPMRFFKFCVKSFSTFYAFDPQKKKLEEKDVVIKFAEIFRTSLPEVQNFKAMSLYGFEGGTWVMWDEITEGDMDSYQIFVLDPSKSGKISKISPEEALVKQFSGDLGDVKLEKIDVSSSEEIQSIDLTRFICSDATDTCTISYEGESEQGSAIELLPEQLYYVKQGHYYLYFIPELEIGKNYWMGIYGVDVDDYKSPAITGITAKSEDKLPPAIVNLEVEEVTFKEEEAGTVRFFVTEIPSYNLDGTELNFTEISRIDLFCANTATPQIGSNLAEQKIVSLGALPFPVLEVTHPFSALKTCPKDLDQTSHFFAIAVDKSGNSFKGEFPTDYTYPLFFSE
jgi:hypothetical protein